MGEKDSELPPTADTESRDAGESLFGASQTDGDAAATQTEPAAQQSKPAQKRRARVLVPFPPKVGPGATQEPEPAATTPVDQAPAEVASEPTPAEPTAEATANDSDADVDAGTTAEDDATTANTATNPDGDAATGDAEAETSGDGETPEGDASSEEATDSEDGEDGDADDEGDSAFALKVDAPPVDTAAALARHGLIPAAAGDISDPSAALAKLTRETRGEADEPEAPQEEALNLQRIVPKKKPKGSSGLIDIEMLKNRLAESSPPPAEASAEAGDIPSFSGMAFYSSLSNIPLTVERPQPTEAEQIVPAPRMEQAPPNNGPLYFIMGAFTIGLIGVVLYLVKGPLAKEPGTVTVYRSVEKLPDREVVVTRDRPETPKADTKGAPPAVGTPPGVAPAPGVVPAPGVAPAPAPGVTPAPGAWPTNAPPPDTKAHTPAPAPAPAPAPEPKPEPKVEKKPDPKPEPKVEKKPEPKVEKKPEPKVEKKPEKKPEPKPEPKVEKKPTKKDEGKSSESTKKKKKKTEEKEKEKEKKEEPEVVANPRGMDDIDLGFPGN